MKRSKFYLPTIICVSLLTIVFFFPACRNDKDPLPLVLADSTGIYDILDNTAKVTVSLMESVPGSVTRYGFVWGENTASPTISDSKIEFNGALPSPVRYTSLMQGLKKNTEYRLRAFVETDGTVIYGALRTFSTQPDYVKRLVQTLNDSLKGKGFGYSFIVTRKAEIVGEGFGGFQARSIEQGGERLVSLDSKMQVASMTKTITSVAFLKLAEEKGIPINTPIITYLPPSWTKGINTDRITFGDLLKHRSGITGFNEACQNGAFAENIYRGLKSLIQRGVRTDNIGKFCYQNANFGMYRVLIPALLGYQFTGNDQVDDEATRVMYENYIKENVFAKLGVTSSEIFVNPSQSPVYGYDHPYTEGGIGYDAGDFTNTAGGYGLYLSAREAAKIYGGLFSTTDVSVLSAAMKDSVLTGGMASYSTITPQGKFFYHDGWWQFGLVTGKAKGFRSLWMKCPDDLTVVIFTNALRNGDGLFPIRSDFYSDITSYVLWAFSGINTNENSRRSQPVNFHNYLQHPEPH
ncbi:serine hydrolase [Dyadobacter luteus]|uniref:Serine hydrolase n=1 Tax=Dyadobacter luteus TaxID=2259619 RepID=A0A3D8YF80_9BACT|nr:serine hydrolase domain-containing protein [Dyadobacter luteus]REA63289.1 serine hydrolase [Dyadobacter luteus]